MRGWQPLLFLCLLGHASPSGDTFRIAGVVVRGDDGKPLSHVRVTILQNEHPERRAALVTAEDGRFLFTDVPAAKYTLAAALHGQQATFEQDGPYSTGIVAGPSSDSEHIVFRFPTFGRLALKVSDEEDEPVQNVSAFLFHRTVLSGWRTAKPDAPVFTDSEGTVAFPPLEEGSYYVLATGRPWYAANEWNIHGVTAGENVLDVAYPATFYPASSDAQGAAPIVLRAGEKRQIQMTLRATPAARIALASSPDNSGATQISGVSIVGPGGARVSLPTYMASMVDGETWLTGLAPGHYILAASHDSFPPGFAGSVVAATQPLGSLAITAGPGETKVQLTNMVRTTVSGRISFAAGVQPVKALTLWLGQPRQGEYRASTLAADGTFRFVLDSSGPGEYDLRLPATENLYPEAITVQGGAYRSGLIDIRDNASVWISMKLAAGLTHLDGVALRDGKPLAGAMILAVPQGGPSAFFPRDQSDSDGTFTLQGVAPGRYLLLAIDHGRNLAYHEPGVLEPYLKGAQMVSIPRPTKEPVIVSVQSRLP